GPNDDCGLVQLSNEYDLSYVLANYPYESGTTATMKGILGDIVEETEKLVPLNGNDVVLDIGGNDGTMLNLLAKPVKNRVNMDAAAGVNSVIDAPDYIKIQGLFNSKAYLELNIGLPKVIFSVAMFYHLNDPLSFCKDVYEIMDDDTVWCLQMTYLGTMLEDNIFDNIVHEHVSYYSLKSLEYLMNKVGLEVCEAKIVKSYGGSIRAYIKKSRKGFSQDRVEYKHVAEYERNHKTNDLSALLDFNTRSQMLKDFTKTLIGHLVEKYGKMVAFGASTKGNMICQFVGLDSTYIKCVLDNNEKKVGLMTTGTDIPIVDETEYLKSVPPYLFILPYYYTDFFISVIRKRLKKDESTYLIVPLPMPKFIKVTGV
ncbi:MAG TPA: hypothetical protein DIT07_12465, partial [Sphingobacteriaceae bacterium]|nr:hypothetical protein [Sphingobacteriaceae bacterium]